MRLGISKALLFLLLDNFFGDHIGEFFLLFDAGTFFFGTDRQTSSQGRSTDGENTQ